VFLDYLFELPVVAIFLGVVAQMDADFRPAIWFFCRENLKGFPAI
jgi:hypothetical protein